MKVLVTGACGQLGSDVMHELVSRGMEAVATDIRVGAAELPGGVAYVKLDLTDSAAVMETVGRIRPDAVIHCAAWTAVDAAEEPENREMVWKINVDGTRNMAAACQDLGCKMLYISTDYVFDGSGEKPWEPDCKAYAPLNFYGESKLAGELAVAELLERYFIVRIAWAFGKNGTNFVQTILRAGKTHDSVCVVNDQIGTPTYTKDLAFLLVDMIQTERYGYYHATNEGGYISWFDYTREIYRLAGIATEVIPVTTAEYGLSKARRPLNSRLDRSKLTRSGFSSLPPWKDALERYLRDIGEAENQKQDE